MFIDKKILNFFKTAKNVCSSKNSEIGGVLFNGKKFAVANRQVQINYLMKNPENCPVMVLPLIAINYLSAFKEGSKVIFEPSADNKTVVIKSGRSKSTFALLTYEMPAIAEIDSDTTIECQLNALDVLKDVLTASDREAPKPMATAIFLRNVNGTLIAHSTNGLKLAISPIQTISKPFSAQVSNEMLSLILSSGLLKESEKFNISMSQNNRKLIFTNEQTTIAVPIVDCSVFEYEPLLVQINNSKSEIKFNRNELLSALKKAEICNMSGKPAKFVISGENIEIRLNETVSDFSEYVTVKGTIPQDVTIGFYIQMVFSALSVFDTDEVTLCYVSGMSAYYFTDGILKYLITPVRI